jgi:hypothetical protein
MNGKSPIANLDPVRPEPFDFAQDRLVEGQSQGFDRLSPNGIWLPG